MVTRDSLWPLLRIPEEFHTIGQTRSFSPNVRWLRKSAPPKTHSGITFDGGATVVTWPMTPTWLTASVN